MKKQFRKQLRETIAGISQAAIHSRSVDACRILCEQPEYRDAQTVMIFLSTAQEVDTTQLALQAWSDLKRVLAPRVSWEQRRMLPIEIHSLTSDVREGYLGIREPVEGMPIPVSDIDLVVVPGLGFDGKGNRLGRGRGFYDRFLSHRDFRAVTCGLAFEEQIIESVPSAEHDVRVAMVVTDRRAIRFGA